MMTPRIETRNTETLLVGMSSEMTLSNDKTAPLFASFMPRRHEINDTVPPNIYCVQIFMRHHQWSDFTPHDVFTKWAAVEVRQAGNVPPGMSVLRIPAGLYAVFLYKGRASDFSGAAAKIFGEWFPASQFTLDHRPHFQVMGPGYKADDPQAQEELWFPVKQKES